MSESVGAVLHGNCAVLVTVSSDFTLLDRRRVELTHGLPTHPHHHQGSWAIGRYAHSPWAQPVTLPQAIALVEQVAAAADQGALAALQALATDLRVGVLALKRSPELPPTIEARIRDNRAQTVADPCLYRSALAGAARTLGWRVHTYDRDTVVDAATRALGTDATPFIRSMAEGPPWRARHKLAAAAAIAALP
jgi:hypothetical protein